MLRCWVDLLEILFQWQWEEGQLHYAQAHWSFGSTVEHRFSRRFRSSEKFDDFSEAIWGSSSMWKIEQAVAFIQRRLLVTWPFFVAHLFYISPHERGKWTNQRAYIKVIQLFMFLSFSFRFFYDMTIKAICIKVMAWI